MEKLKVWLSDRNKITILTTTLAPLTIILPFILGMLYAKGEINTLYLGIFLVATCLAQAAAHQAIRAATISELMD